MPIQDTDNKQQQDGTAPAIPQQQQKYQTKLQQIRNGSHARCMVEQMYAKHETDLT